MCKIRALLIGMMAIVSLTTPALASSPWADLDTDRLARTCNYFENKARFLDRGPDMSLDALFADSCRLALHRITDVIGTSPYEARRARTYLERLTDYKAVVIEMNTAGFAAVRNKRPTAQSGVPGLRVSTTGEYLIAREIGVFEVYRDWAKASNFTTAGNTTMGQTTNK